MYLVMNRFRVKVGFEAAFEEVWRSRESKLLERVGFVRFDLLKGGRKRRLCVVCFACSLARQGGLCWLDQIRTVSGHPMASRKMNARWNMPALRFSSALK